MSQKTINGTFFQKISSSVSKNNDHTRHQQRKYRIKNKNVSGGTFKSTSKKNREIKRKRKKKKKQLQNFLC